MNESQRLALKRYHQRIAEDIIVTEDLLGEMYQVGIFEQAMIQIIRVSLSVSLTDCLPACLFACLPTYLHVCLSGCLGSVRHT